MLRDESGDTIRLHNSYPIARALFVQGFKHMGFFNLPIPSFYIIYTGDTKNLHLIGLIPDTYLDFVYDMLPSLWPAAAAT